MSGFVISIHAPPRGATAQAFALLAAVLQFQFTPLREGRLDLVALRKELRISIHAPPRGATVTGFARLRRLIFQFTPLREGRRAVVHLLHNQVAQFQFTPLREGRHYISGKRRHCRSDFNSRPSARGDAHSAAVRCFSAAFQFTPLREGRLFRRLSNVKKHYFNSRPSARGDARLVGCAQAPPISIHAPPRGATSRFFHAAFAALFQFTPLREGRHGIKNTLQGSLKISIHAPPRGATSSAMFRRSHSL